MPQSIIDSPNYLGNEKCGVITINDKALFLLRSETWSKKRLEVIFGKDGTSRRNVPKETINSGLETDLLTFANLIGQIVNSAYQKEQQPNIRYFLNPQ
ncbi:MAG: hypothetical protein AABX10_00070 [Nanoarchaeota archaeon]